MEQNSNSFVRGKFSGTTLTCTLVQGVARHFSAARPPRGCRGGCAQLAFPVLTQCVCPGTTPGAPPDL